MKMMLLIGLVAGTLGGNLARAMTYEVSTVTSSAGQQMNLMRMTGIIDNGEWSNWEEATSQLDPKLNTLFVLNSPGGNVPMGMFLIRKVEAFLALHKETKILVENDCSSMCVPLYYAWENRFALPDARIGLHGVSLGFIGYDAQMSDFYFHSLLDRAVARNDGETREFLGKMLSKGEFSSTVLTPHKAVDLAKESSGLIPDHGIVNSKEELIDRTEAVIGSNGSR